MRKREKEILWHLLRNKSSNETAIALIGEKDPNERGRFCEVRGFSFDEASKAVSALFDSIKPTE